MKYIFSRISKIKNRSIFIRVFTAILAMTVFGNTAFKSSAFSLDSIIYEIDDSSSEDDYLNPFRYDMLWNQFDHFRDIDMEPSVLGGSYCDLELELFKLNPHSASKYAIHPLIDIRALNNLRTHLENIGWCSPPPYDGNNDNMFFLACGNQKWVPAIIMEVDDHNKTKYLWTKNQKSFDQSRQNVLCKLQTVGLVKKGHLRHWLEYELSYLSDMFDDKYDKALDQVRNYINKLEITEEHNGHVVTFKNPNDLSKKVSYPVK